MFCFGESVSARRIPSFTTRRATGAVPAVVLGLALGLALDVVVDRVTLRVEWNKAASLPPCAKH